jgi:hypothetical protein
MQLQYIQEPSRQGSNRLRAPIICPEFPSLEIEQMFDFFFSLW